MRNPTVYPLRTPQEGKHGRRQIVFPDGKIERTAVIKSPLDWNVRIAIEDEPVRKTFCVCVSPDGDAMTVDRWQPMAAPSRVELNGEVLTSRLGGNPNDMETNDIVSAVKDELG